VSACHISSSLIALAGIKLLPTSQGCCWYQLLAFSSDQRDATANPGLENARMSIRITQLDGFTAAARMLLEFSFSVLPSLR
jgi:hypothetical protein